MALPYVTVHVDTFQLTGQALAGATVVLTLPYGDVVQPAYGGGIVALGRTTIACDASGLGSGPAFSNACGTQGTQYGVAVYDASGVQVFPAPGRQVPAALPAQDCNLHDVLFTIPPTSQSDADAAIAKARAWASQDTNPVETTPAPLYSAKYYSVQSANSAGQASGSATLASEWASFLGGPVSGGLFSALEYASGSDTGTGGSARNWAQQTGSDVMGAPALSRSAKSWAQDNLTGATYGGSARDWAVGAGLIDGVHYSSSYYATAAAASAQAAAASQQQAANSQTQTTIDRTAADADLAAVQALTLTATAQASAAMAAAASASSVAQQDLSGTTAQAVHRSPNAVVATCFMDVSKDSNPLWPDQCQNLSYQTETLNGPWVAHPNQNGTQSEIIARALGGTLGATNLLAGANGTLTGWSVPNASGTLSLGNSGRLRLTNGTNSNCTANFNVTGLTVGQVYLIYLDLLSISANSTNVRGSADGGSTWGLFSGANPNGAFVFTATSTTLLLQVYNSNITTGAYNEYGNFHLHAVTAFAPSGSYYPSAADGKFYRLWKNIVQQSEFQNGAADMTNCTGLATASAFSGGTGGPTTGVAVGRDGVTSTVIRAKNNPTIPAGVPVVISFLITLDDGGAGGAPVIGTGAGADLSLVIGNVDLSGAATSVTSLGGGLYRVTAFYNTTAQTTVNGLWKYSNNSARTFKLSAMQIQYATAFDSYESKGADQSQTEVFRGNKPRAPRFGLAVAEASRVVIYDLLEPGCPMWMVFTVPNNTQTVYGRGAFWNFKSIFYISGELLFGSTSGSGAAETMLHCNLSKDTFDLYTFGGGLSGRASANIANRNATGVTFTGSYPGLSGTTANAISASVMPEAPVDPVTGLQVPTIAVANNGGISIVKHDGSVVNSASTSSFANLTLTPYMLMAGVGNSTTVYALAPANLGASFALTTVNSGTALSLSPTGTSVQGIVAAGRRGMIAARHNAARLSLQLFNESTPGASAEAQITDTSNTGWMLGAIVRAYGCDTLVGAVSAASIVTNGTFDADASGWTGGNSGVPSAVAGNLRVTNSAGVATNAFASYAMTTVVGKTYTVNGSLISNPGGASPCRLMIGTSPAGQDLVYTDLTNPGSFTQTKFTAIGTTTYVTVAGYNTPAGSYTEYDNIIVSEVIPDRSYKGALLKVFGTLTRSQVAAGAQLTALGNFSATNYAREAAHDTALDPNTGPLRLSDWVNVPANPQLYQNLAPKSNLFASGSNWTQDGLTVADGSLSENGHSYALLQQPAATTGNNRIFAYSATTLATTVNNSWLVRRVGTSTDRVAFSASNYSGGTLNATYDPVTQTFTSGGNGWTINVIDANTARISVPLSKTATGAYWNINVPRASDGALYGGGTGGVYVAEYQMTVGPALLSYMDNAGAVTVRCHPSKEYSYSSGTYYTIGWGGDGFPMVELWDSTTRRTASSSSASTAANYATGTFIKLAGEYNTSGTLTLKINSQPVVSTTGNPLATLTNASAVLTVGQNYALNAPFPGSVCLGRIGMTTATDDAGRWMYELEKELFVAGAQCTLPDSGSLVGLDYDARENKVKTVSAAYESSFVGLVRTAAAPVSAGSFTGVSHAQGVKALWRSTTNPGVDITIPAKNLKEELLNEGARFRAQGRELLPLDWVGGFTAGGGIPAGQTVTTSVSGMSFPSGATVVGAQVSGTGLPAGTSITAYQTAGGNVAYFSAASTGTPGNTTMAFSDFILPVGQEAKAVYVNGSRKKEGSTYDFTRLFDGFRETVRFNSGATPGSAANVTIDPRRMVQ